MVIIKLILDCDSKCLQCNNIRTCILCRPGFELLNGICYNLCPDGSIRCRDGDCCRCPIEHCRSCDLDTMKCIECTNGFIEKNGECVTTCDRGFYASDGYCLSNIYF